MGRDSAQPRGRRGSFRGKHSSRGQHRRPTNEHYYIGGTAEDPLNLNNVGIEPTEDEEVFIPKNKHDPLNLNQSIRKRKLDESHDSTSPTKKKVEEPDAAELEKATAAEEAARKKREKKEHFNRKFRYGNFDKYYGVRLGPGEKDPRVMSFSKDWFYKKSVLDIGCNVGFLTLSLAKDFAPRRILGIDIDEHLIGVARKNIRHYCDASTEFAGKYPVSFAKQFGPISGHSLSFSSKFPDNVWFRKENYVFENDESLETVEPEFDVVLALSVTKWIHLNWGDDGMRRFFLRIFKHLLPGGRFILEPQPFQTYSKRAKMTPELWTNYRAIEFKPEDFEMYLLETVGFERVEQLGVPCAKTKGFERPLQVYVKAGGLTTSASPATTVVTTGTVTSPVTVSSTSTVPSNATVSPTATETGSSAPDVEHHPGSPSSIAS